MSELQNIESEAKKALSFLVQPSHLILATLLFVSIWVGIYLYDSRRAQAAESEAALSKARAESDMKANAAIQAANERTIQQLQQANEELQQANSQLATANAQRLQNLSVQKIQDATLPPDQLVARLIKLQPAGTAKVISGGYQVDQPEMVAIVQSLDELMAVKANLAADGQLISNQQQQLLNSNSALASEKAAHASDNQASQSQLKAKDDELKKVKADAARDKKRAFLRGGMIVTIVVEAFRIFVVKHP